MGLIMNQVNYPQKMVWAHFKLDTYNSEDILPYLKGSTINELPEELLGQNEKDKPVTTREVLSNSIFEESEDSESTQRHDEPLDSTTFCSKLDSIGEFDPYGASLVSLLSRIRTLSIRDSIPIT
jgi:hypothetical protein